MNDKKFAKVGNWVKCLCVFVPQEIPMDQWEVMSIEVKEDKALWTAFRFRISEVQEYSRSPYKNATWLLFKNGSYKNIDIPLDEFDKLIFEP